MYMNPVSKPHAERDVKLHKTHNSQPYSLFWVGGGGGDQ